MFGHKWLKVFLLRAGLHLDSVLKVPEDVLDNPTEVGADPVGADDQVLVLECREQEPRDQAVAANLSREKIYKIGVNLCQMFSECLTSVSWHTHETLKKGSNSSSSCNSLLSLWLWLFKRTRFSLIIWNWVTAWISSYNNKFSTNIHIYTID